LLSFPSMISYHRAMVSASWAVAGRESMLGALARWLTRRRRDVGAFLAVAVRFVLVVAGLGLPVAGVWMLAGAAWGLIVAGPAALVLEYVVKRR
jgi:hypothetical protein